MTAVKATGQSSPRPTTAAAVVPSTSTAPRKPWKKKGPIEVVLDQIGKVREDVADKERELALAKRQLQKLEEAAKLLEST